MSAAEGLIEKYKLEREALIARLHAARENSPDDLPTAAAEVAIRELLAEIVELDELIRQLGKQGDRAH